MKLTDIVTRHVITVCPETPLAEAAALMSDHRISCLIALSDNRPVGILTEADLVHIYRLGVDAEATAVSEFMSHPLISAHSQMDIFEVYDFLLEKNMRHLVVLNNRDELEGVVTLSDILKATEFDDYLHAKQISDVMRSPIISLPGEQLVQLALEKMDAVHISCVVVTENEKAVGIFTERDAARLIAAKQNASQLTLAEVMTSPLKTLKPEDPLILASTTMRKIATRRLVIVDDADEPVGLITQFDVIRGLEGVSVRHFKALYDRSELKLEESSRLLAEKSELERIVAASPGVLYRCEWQGDMENGAFYPTYFSPQIEQMLGDSPSGLLHPEWWKTYVHPDDQNAVHACLQKITCEGERDLIYRVATASGKWLWILDHARVSRDADGRPLEMVGSWLDITERRQTEQALSEREDRFYKLFNEARDMMHIVGADGAIIDVNQIELDTLGYSREELIGKPILDIVGLEFQESTRQRIGDLFAGEMAPLAEIVLRKKDGSTLDVEVLATPQFDDDSNVVAGRAIIRDISKRKAVERALQASEEKYRSLFDEATDMIHITDTDGRVTDVNQAELARLGYSYDEMVGREILDVVAPECRNRWVDMVGNVLRGESFSDYGTVFLTRAGEPVDVEISATPRLDADGNVAAARAIMRDITERKRVEQSLKLAQFALDQAVDAIYWMTPDGRFLYVNEAASKLLGYSRDELLNMGVADIDPTLPEGVPPEMAQATRDAGFGRVETTHRCKDGRLLPVEVMVGCFEYGSQEYHCSFVRDISERKEYEDRLVEALHALEASEGRLKSLIQTIPDLIWLKDPDGLYLRCNHAFERFFGASEAEIIGKSDYDFVDKELADFFREKDKAAIAVGKPTVNEEWIKFAEDGHRALLETIKTPMWDSEGNLIGVLGIGRDISLRKEMELQLESERASLNAILNNLPFLAWLKDEQGQYLTVNDLFAKACGAESAESVVGKSDLDLWPQELATAYRLDDLNVMESRRSRQVEEQVAIDGEMRWVETFKSPILDHCGMVVGTAGMAYDITERLNSEEQMRLLESAVASVNESIIITDLEGVIVYVNPAFTKNTGFSPEEALGSTPAILNSKQQSEGFYEKFWHTIQHGKAWDGRILDRKKDGTIFPVHLSVAPIVDADQKMTHFVAVHDDLSESEAMQRQMMQSQKMEAVGTMVGGVAHDFNNLLASIVGNLYLLRNHHKDDAATVSRIRAMENAVQYGAQLIQQMLTFARKDRTEMHAMDLKGFIKEAYKLAKATVPENISFTLDYTPHEDLWVKGDATQMQQVLLNLVANAQHAVRSCEKPEIVVELQVVWPDENTLAEFPEMASQEQWCCLSCSDNGCGMDAGLLERVFDPFFTTKAVGEGTGLGLSMVYGAVQNHRGFIKLNSEPEKGTKVSICLPLYSGEAIEVKGRDEADVDGSGFTIMLVDDEESLRQVLSEVLRHSGFNVLQAVDGEEAVSLFEKRLSEIDLVLMDVVMPNMGGVAAAKEIRKISGAVPIIFQTGYGEQTQLDAAASIAHSDAIQKPVEIPVLMELIMSKLMH